MKLSLLTAPLFFFFTHVLNVEAKDKNKDVDDAITCPIEGNPILFVKKSSDCIIVASNVKDEIHKEHQDIDDGTLEIDCLDVTDIGVGNSAYKDYVEGANGQYDGGALLYTKSMAGCKTLVKILNGKNPKKARALECVWMGYKDSRGKLTPAREKYWWQWIKTVKTYATCPLDEDTSAFKTIQKLFQPTALSKTSTSAGAQGDPHFKTWSQKLFDFHGVCDLKMLSNEKFENNLGMDIHIRTKKMRMWSYISSLAIRIGNDILEVIGRNGGLYILNGTTNQGNVDGALMLAGYPINYTQKSSKQQTFRLNFSTQEAIVIETWNSFVSVRFENPNSEHFKDSVGLLGSFPNGIWLARDKVTIINDVNSFGQEWQVLEHEANMFHEVEGPQQPLKKCEIPSKLNMRRHLSEHTMTQSEAERACISAKASNMDLCIFDVMATNSKLTSGAY